MKIEKFIEDLKKGSELAYNAGFANMYLSDEKTKEEFEILEKFCSDLVGTWGMAAEDIKEIFSWAQETIEWKK